MAITAATMTSDFSGFLSRDQAQPIFDEARRRSVVQQLARQVRLGINGEAIPITTGKATAEWVSEGGQKPASEGARSLVFMDPEKIATIIVVSAEVVRANPAGYMNDVRDDAAEAFANAFDAAVLYGTNTPFDAFLAETGKGVTFGTGVNVYSDLVAGLSLLVADGRRLSGFAFGLEVEPLLLGELDGMDRPLWTDAPTDGVVDGQLRGRMLGRPAILDEALADGTDLGFGGDWTKIAWGAVGGISYAISTEATVTIDGNLTSLWENNLVAIKAEAEYGVVIEDVEHFVQFSTT